MWTLASEVHVLWLRRTNSHGRQKSCGEKGMAWPLSKWERALTPAWTGFYCFSGYITLRIVLIYYAQVCCRLPFIDNKGKNVASCFKEKDVTDQGGKWLNWLHSILRRFTTDFRKLLQRYAVNICCLNAGWESFSKSKPQSSLGTMQAWFPTGEPICGHGSCVPTSFPVGFPNQGLGYIPHATWDSPL